MDEIRLRAWSRSREPSFLEAFSALPEHVRQGQELQGCPPASLWSLFLKMAPPQSEFWIAHVGTQAVGRIGVFAMDSHPGLGGIGFFELDTRHALHEAIADRLISTAREWLIAKGLKQAVAPLNLSTWFSYRFRTDEQGRAFLWEPNQPSAYPDYFLERGFEVCERYSTTGLRGLDRFVESTRSAYETALAKGFRFRPFDADQVLEKEVPLLHRISLAGFKENYLYEPISLEAFRYLYVPLAKKMDYSHCCFVLNPQGQEIGFFFGFVEGQAFVMKSVTVVPEARGLGLSNAMIHFAARPVVEKGGREYIAALVREGNRSESYARKGEEQWRHEYALLRAELR